MKFFKHLLVVIALATFIGGGAHQIFAQESACTNQTAGKSQDQAFGGFGVLVDKTADFPKAYEAAKASGKPAILHLKVDPAAITPTMTIEAIRSRALAAGTH